MAQPGFVGINVLKIELETDRQTDRQGSTNRLQSLISSAILETNWVYFRPIALDLMFKETRCLKSFS